VVTNPPIVRFFEWDTAEIADPVGTRHLEGGSFAFKQRVARGCFTYSGVGTSGTLQFEGTSFDVASQPSHIESKVTAVSISLGTSGVAISNMRVYLKDDSGLLASKDQGLDPAIIQYTASGIWQPNAVLPSGIAPKLSTVIPVNPNLSRHDGFAGLEGQDDVNASQYAYMNVLIPFGAPLGTYGICGSGRISIGLTFDYFDV
jgi:hypothetical protein